MSSTREFTGTPRFRILRKLGQGGMGVVYEAEDTERRIRVALKTLVFATPAGLYRFKQEFRSIADIVHPNLISLYEFFAEGDVWFFTMEFIEGQHFLESTRSTTSVPPLAAAATTRGSSRRMGPDMPTVSASSISESEAMFSGPGQMLPQLPADVERTRSVARQVAAGLCAVHAAGKLHRDVKSSNVLVTPQGRAVVLDFGLAAEVAQANLESASGEIVGTVAYMSPEQIAGRPLSPASDWYSFGVMLYEALTGQMPFDGPKAASVRQRLETEPAPAGEIVSGIPEELERLCSDLLRKHPSQRPKGEEVLARLSARPAAAASTFVGRKSEEAKLLQAISAARAGAAAVALVRGPSGVGKSALVQHFIEGHELRDALILRGRCYEQESMPYKAFDSAVDMLCQHLRRDAGSLDDLLPEDLGPLTQIFPVFRQIDQIADQIPAAREQGDAQDVRRRAFQGFRELLARLRQRQQVVFCLDDLHWADVESARLLSALLAPPNPPAVLFCCSFRSEYEQRSEFLKALRSREADGAIEQFDVPLSPLGSQEALELAEKLMGARDVAGREDAQRIVEESGGNPYFLCELARSSGEGFSRGAAGVSTLDQIIWRRVSLLPEPAQQLLYVIALFGQPLAQADAYQAAGFASRDPLPLGSLRHENLVRTAGAQELDSVETFHDRVRETVVRRLSSRQRSELHGKIAATLERSGRADAETLGVHFEGAGDLEKAAGLYQVAAQQSSAALAFDHAAELYERVLQLGDHPAETRSALHASLGDALANAGRGLRAARQYEQAAQFAAPGQRLELERNAAFHFCSSGHVEEGLDIFRRVLGRVGLQLSSPRMAVLKFVWHLVRLRLHGQHFEERLPGQIPAKVLEQFDCAWAVAAPMVQVDLLQSLNFGTLGLLLALRAGDPKRLVRGTQNGAYLISVQGKQGRQMADWLVEQCDHYAAQLADPYLRGSVALSRTGISYIGGEWRACCKHALEAERILTSECKGTRWEVASLWTLYVYSLWSLGEFVELGQRTSRLLETAIEREDLYSYANLAVFCEPLVLAAADQPRQARAAVDKGLERWPYRGFHLQHVMAAHAKVWIDFYEGHGAKSLESVRATWQMLRDNSFHNHPNLKTIWQDHLGRTALAAAAVSSPGSGERTGHLRFAKKIAQKLAANPFPWAQATAFVIRGGLERLQGEPQAAADLMLEAARRFQEQDMACYAASARRYAGEFRGGEDGRKLIAEADEWMRSQNIARPDRMAAMHVGGYSDAV